MPSPSNRSVFISYSHLDEAWKNRLTAQLGTLEWEGLLGAWHDGLIQPGAAWLSEIERAVDQAQVAVLLVSPNFLVSPFIRSREIPALIERRSAQDLRIIPLIVSPCPWRQVPWLAAIQARPLNGKTLLELSRAKAEKELATVAEEILALVQKSPRPDTTVVELPSMPMSAAQTMAQQARPAAPGFAAPARSDVATDFLTATPDESAFGLHFRGLQFQRTLPASKASLVGRYTFQSQPYIVKKTPRALCDEAALRELCGRRIEAFAGLRVSMLTPIEIRVVGNVLYELLPFVEGIAMDVLIERNRQPLHGNLLANIYQGFTRILRTLRDLEILHRDIRPGNFLFTGRDMALIDATFACKASSTAPTVSNQFYSAPEQNSGSPCVQSDWYSFGATLFFLASGSPPDLSHREEFLRKLAQIQTGNQTFDLGDEIERLPEELDPLGLGAVLYSLLQPNPEDRPSSLPYTKEHSGLLPFEIRSVLDMGPHGYLVLFESSWEILDKKDLEDVLRSGRYEMSPELKLDADSFLAGRPRWLRN